ncbi:hypothetical protein IMSAGC002_02259 [Lachnospiraceae bacterium]|nr:hypothetical protein IMSAGC002_02259 [Lachnospiraceae bacterium]
MRKTYKCSNIKFCMEDEKQRRTWEFLQSMTRKDGSYGKILSDAFVEAVNGKTRLGENKVGNGSVVLDENATDIFEEMLDRVLEEKFHEMLPKLQEVLAEQISRAFREYVTDFHSVVDASVDKTDIDGVEQMQEPELSEDMMAFAFAMGE